MSEPAAWPLDELARLPHGVWLRITDSHDVTGGNNDGFQSLYSYLYRDDDGWVLFDHKGPGCILLVRTIGFVTTLKAFIDDEPTPRVSVPFADLYSGRADGFPAHLVCDEERGHGSAWSFVPIPFRTRCRLVAPEKLESYHFFTVWAHVYDAPETAERRDGRLLDRTLWEDPGRPPSAGPGVRALHGTCAVPAFGATPILDRAAGGTVRWLRLRLGDGSRRPDVLEGIRIRAWWDDHPCADVEAPIGLFFAAGLPDEQRIARTEPYRVVFGGQPMDVRLGRTRPRAIPVGELDDGTYYCRFPMPFWKAAHIELANFSAASVEGVEWEIGLDEATMPLDSGYFRAWYRHEDGTIPHRDYTILDVRGHGTYVGCVMRMSSRMLNRAVGFVQRHYLEGDARLYVDDARAFLSGSTGTEEYFNWGWYDVLPKDEPFAFPTHGYVEHARDIHDHTTMYRFHVADPVPYYRSFRFDIEHGPEGEIPSDYGSVAFHYHRDDAALVLTDALDVSDRESERAHRYGACGDATGGAARRGILWEGRRTLVHEGNDQVLDRVARSARGESWEAVAGITDDGRAWRLSCEFTVALRPDNRGAKLRRRYDGEWPPGEPEAGARTRVVAPQEAIVSVDGREVGRWYLPGHHARRTWMEDEFEIPAAFTAGKDRVHVRLAAANETGWNEYRYWVFSYLP